MLHLGDDADIYICALERPKRGGSSTVYTRFLLIGCVRDSTVYPVFDTPDWTLAFIYYLISMHYSKP